MVEKVPFQPGMRLGRVYDLNTCTTGRGIFPEDAIRQPCVEDVSDVKALYSVVKRNSDIRDFLDVSADMSLKVKAMVVAANTSTSLKFLAREQHEDNKILIIAKCHVETITQSISDDVDPKDNPTVTGGYYIRTITYGGDLLASVNIRTKTDENMRELQANLESSFQSPTGIVNLDIKASFSKIASDLTSNEEVSIQLDSTVSSVRLPRDINSMLNALDNFPREVLRQNEKKGVPLLVEIVPITAVLPQLRVNLRVPAYNHYLNILEEHFDDVKQAKDHLRSFMSKTQLDLSEEEQNELASLRNNMNIIHDKIVESVFSMNITSRESYETVKAIIEEQRRQGFHADFLPDIKRKIKRFTEAHIEEITVCEEDLKKLPKGKELTMVLFSKTGHGKSSSGNTIVGTDKFQVGHSSESTTKEVRKEAATVGGRDLVVIDTPGTMDTTSFRTQKGRMLALEELAKTVCEAPDGFDAFLIVWKYGTKMTEEENKALGLLQCIFGKESLQKYGIIVFSNGDSQKKSKDTFETYCKQEIEKWKTHPVHHGNKTSGACQEDVPSLGRIIEEAGNRCILFDNHETDTHANRDQVVKLIEVVDGISRKNNRKKFTCKYNDIAMQIKKENKKYGDMQEAVKTSMEADANCFPVTAIVTRYPHGHTIPICEVRVGDHLLSTDSSGDVLYQEVYMIGHADPGATMSAVSVMTKSSRITASTGHFIFTGGETDRVDWRATKLMEDIGVGDKLLVYDPISEKMVQEEVQSVQRTEARGMYNPMTLGGTLLVDNILATCYERHVTPRYAHPLLWPIRMLYKVKPGWLDAINTHRKDGIPIWALKFCQNIPIFKQQ